MAARKTALITGCGYVGARLNEKLEFNNWIVKGIRRKKSCENGFISIDVSHPFDLSDEFDFVFYAGYENPFWTLPFLRRNEMLIKISNKLENF